MENNNQEELINLMQEYESLHLLTEYSDLIIKEQISSFCEKISTPLCKRKALHELCLLLFKTKKFHYFRILGRILQHILAHSELYKSNEPLILLPAEYSFFHMIEETCNNIDSNSNSTIHFWTDFIYKYNSLYIDNYDTNSQSFLHSLIKKCFSNLIEEQKNQTKENDILFILDTYITNYPLLKDFFEQQKKEISNNFLKISPENLFDFEINNFNQEYDLLVIKYPLFIKRFGLIFNNINMLTQDLFEEPDLSSKSSVLIELNKTILKMVSFSKNNNYYQNCFVINKNYTNYLQNFLSSEYFEIFIKLYNLPTGTIEQNKNISNDLLQEFARNFRLFQLDIVSKQLDYKDNNLNRKEKL